VGFHRWGTATALHDGGAVSADVTGSHDRANTADVIAAELEPLLGPNTARTAIRVFAKHALGVAPEQIRPAEVPKVLDALRPMLNTLLGAARACLVRDAIARRFVP
jgi:hypothetical protein